MSTDSPKQWILPFQRDRDKQVEAGAILALAELERIKGGGFINKQAGEKLLFLAMCGYPLWMYSRKGKVYFFDGLNNSGCTVYYAKMPSAEELMLDLQAKSMTLESFSDYLSDYGDRFQKTQSDQFSLGGLITDSNLMNEFILCNHEATEINNETALYCVLIVPTLSKKAIDDNFAELDSLRLVLKQETEKLAECIGRIKQTTEQHRSELDFLLTATIEEANAKIKACDELITPQVNKIDRKYRRKIASVTNAYNKKIRELESKRNRARKLVDKAEEKISYYRIETERQAYSGHYYERRWAKKFARLERELNSCTRKLETIESRVERTINSKEAEISELGGELSSQTELLKQPLFEVEIEKSDKIKAVRQKIQRLLEHENRLINGINKCVGEWALGSFEGHSLKEISLATPALVYVPFYLICYQLGESKRFLVISPSTFGKIDFSAKLKGIFGLNNVKELLNPRFQAIATLIKNVQELSNNIDFASQLSASANSHNLLTNNAFKKQAQEGLIQLKQEGWLSDKETKLPLQLLGV